MLRIPYVNIAPQHAALKTELLEAVAKVIDSGQFILGPQVQEFEKRFAELCETRFAVGVNSGTDALILALRALGIGPGDEVITATNSFVASAGAIAVAGAQPVMVDVRDDYNIDPSKIEMAVTSRTKAIIPVHLTGRPADMDPIMALAGKYGLHVVEDCAQAVAASYRGKPVGSFGSIGCFSLHPLKTLNACGDGGVLVTSDEQVRDRLRIMRNIGLEARDNCVVWSGNSRLDTLQASLLLVKLNYLEAWTEKRRVNARFYQEGLTGIPEIVAPVDRPHEKAVYHTFVIQAQQRNDLKKYLFEKGIETAVHYPIPIHLQAAAQSLAYGAGSFPVAERQAQRILSLPVYPELSAAQLDRVVSSVRAFYQKPA